MPWEHRSEIKNGKYTGKLAGPFCYGESKVLANNWRRRGYDLAKSVAHSDSISDLPFMQAVGNAVAINGLAVDGVRDRARTGALLRPAVTRSALPKQQWRAQSNRGTLLGPTVTVFDSRNRDAEQADRTRRRVKARRDATIAAARSNSAKPRGARSIGGQAARNLEASRNKSARRNRSGGRFCHFA